jgi:hypothetical protein
MLQSRGSFAITALIVDRALKHASAVPAEQATLLNAPLTKVAAGAATGRQITEL